MSSTLTGGNVIVDVIGGDELLFSQNFACPEHGACIDELSPRMFSFNNPFGACPTCTGLGIFLKVDPNLIIPNKKLSIREGAIRASGWSNADSGTIAEMYYLALGKEYGFTLDTPICDFSKEAYNALLYGTGGKKLKMQRKNVYGTGTYNTEFEGIVNNMERRYKESTSDWARWEIEQVMTACDCPDCKGARLKKESLSVTVGGLNIYELTKLSVTKELDFINTLVLTDREQMIASLILKEIKSRLSFLQNVGLDYLTLSRSAGTLSGGESQRIRLATQIGSSLMGVLYILDEPSIGLHQRDNDKLIGTLKRMRDLGNTLIVVEHDEDTMRAADYIVDIGPGAGVHGGEVVCAGSLDDILKCDRSLTGQYLSGKRKIEVPEKRRSGNGNVLKVIGAAENNLKNINVSFPLGEFICVTGVSGSGKSSLINEILYKQLANDLNGAKSRQASINQ